MKVSLRHFPTQNGLKQELNVCYLFKYSSSSHEGVRYEEMVRNSEINGQVTVLRPAPAKWVSVVVVVLAWNMRWA